MCDITYKDNRFIESFPKHGVEIKEDLIKDVTNEALKCVNEINQWLNYWDESGNVLSYGDGSLKPTGFTFDPFNDTFRRTKSELRCLRKVGAWYGWRVEIFYGKYQYKIVFTKYRYHLGEEILEKKESELISADADKKVYVDALTSMFKVAIESIKTHFNS